MDTADLPFVVGALTFRGRLHEAEHLYRLHLVELDEAARFAARFLLGVGFCRHAHYAKARAYFGENLRAGGHAPDPKARFYVWQGVGFYRLTSGRHQSGYKAAVRALEGALEANFLWGKALASDLMAHHQVLPGEISAAMASFRDALGYAGLLGDGGLTQAIEVSLAIHSAQYGLAPEKDLGELRRLASRVTSEDNYSKSRLLLEIGRQLTLRGDADGAEAALNEACQLIYASKNRRYGIVLNLRYAYLMHLAGEAHQALNLVRNAAKELDPEVDRALTAEVLGLERRILQAWGQEGGHAGFAEEAKKLLPRLTALSGQTGRVVGLRILAREQEGRVNLQKLGDDPLGDLLDLARLGGVDAPQRLIERGYLGLILHLMPEALGKKALVFDLVPGGVLILDKGRVRHGTAGFSSVIRAIAKALSGGEASKQQLIEMIWGYRYQPLKHDALIYRNVSRLRAMLGAAASWLEVTESGYRFADGINVTFRGNVEPGATVAEEDGTIPTLETPTTKGAPTRKPAPTPQNVNYRQLKLLEHLAVAPFVDVKTAAALFKMSEITARRDLSQLADLNLVARLGKGRATRYCLAAPSPPTLNKIQ